MKRAPTLRRALSSISLNQYAGPSVESSHPLQPAASSPSSALFSTFAGIATPALVYDLENLARSIRVYQDDLSLIPRNQLNLALKSCHTPEVLSFVANLGLGADVASPRELALAKGAGFSEISATGPSFTSDTALDLLDAEKIILDASSLDQLIYYGTRRPGTEVGLRLRIPIPKILDSLRVFGENSRFGIQISDPELHEALSKYDLTVTRLHMHTGQMTPASLIYKFRYTLAIASAIPTVSLIDFGGGFFDLYADRQLARAAIREAASLVEEWEEKHGRRLEFRFEPGGAILGPHGYLLVSVQSIERQHPYFGHDLVQVDSSAWNFAPWHTPQVIHVNKSKRDAPIERRILAGNTLYENDFFGTPPERGISTIDVPTCTVDDMLVMTNSGAYTMTNRRDFNLLGNLKEYVFDGIHTVEIDPQVMDNEA